MSQKSKKYTLNQTISWRFSKMYQKNLNPMLLKEYHLRCKLKDLDHYLYNLNTVPYNKLIGSKIMSKEEMYSSVMSDMEKTLVEHERITKRIEKYRHKLSMYIFEKFTLRI